MSDLLHLTMDYSDFVDFLKRDSEQWSSPQATMTILHSIGSIESNLNEQEINECELSLS